MTDAVRRFAPGVVGLIAILVSTVTSAEDVKIKIPGGTAHLRTLKGVKEPPVPVLRDGVRVAVATGGEAARFHVIEVYPRTPGTEHFPLLWADLVANTYLRQTYPRAEGPGARLGTSLVTVPSFRVRDGLHFLPTVLEATIDPRGPGPIFRTEIVARYAAPAAEVTSRHRFGAPVAERTESRVSIHFVARADIELERGSLRKDAYRLVTLSSMFADPRNYDANVLMFDRPSGRPEKVEIGSLAGRNEHLFGEAVEVGSWLELVKEPGSGWFPDSPCIRVEIERWAGPGRLGVQGFLAATRDRNDDSLSVWLEWLDAPGTVLAGTTLHLDLKIIATPPRRAVP